jgi:signal transduction protein with GAF and PtsI domain
VELSVAPPSLPLLKLVVRSVPASVADAAAERALEAGTATDVRDILRAAVRPHLDLALIDGGGALPGSKRPTTFP